MLVFGIGEPEANYFFSFTCSTAPFLGVTIGGLVFSAMGGYNKPRAWGLVALISILTVASALPIPFLCNKWLVYVLFWFTLFFGSIILATMTGMMLNSNPIPLRATANGVAVFTYNILGYLPAPAMYGWVSEWYVEKNSVDEKWQKVRASRWAMGMILFWAVYAVGCYWGALALKLRALRR